MSTTTNIDYSGASAPGDCGKFESAGYWDEVGKATVFAGGEGLVRKYTLTQATSNGMSNSRTMVEQFSEAMASTTYMETTVSAG